MLFYKIEGNEGTWLTIIHGLFGSLDNWQTLARQWSHSYKVLSIDVRNHGRSPHYNTMSYDEMIEDILEIFKFLNIDQSVILGHSMGGKIAMHLAAKHPEKIEKLIIADVAPFAYEPKHNEIFEILSSIQFEKYENRKDIEQYILSKMPNDFATAQFILKNIKRNEDNMKFEFKFNLNVLKLNYQNIISYVPSIGFKEKVLFLAGEKSDYITSSTTIHLFDLYPNAEIEIIKNAGHWVHAENPSEVYEKVNAFINN